MTKLICEIGHNHLGCAKCLYSFSKKLDNKIVDGVSLQIKTHDLYKSKKYSKYFIDYKTINNFLYMAKKKFNYVGVALNDISTLKFIDLTNINFFKILSIDIKNYKLIRLLKKTKINKIFVSTGFSNLKEVEKTLQKVGKKKIHLIHTTFPKDDLSIKFSRIDALKRFNLPVSYGNHSKVIETIPYSAFFKPEHIFIYIKHNFKPHNIGYLDNKHAVRIKNVKNIYIKMQSIKNLL